MFAWCHMEDAAQLLLASPSGILGAVLSRALFHEHVSALLSRMYLTGGSVFQRFEGQWLFEIDWHVKIQNTCSSVLLTRQGFVYGTQHAHAVLAPNIFALGHTGHGQGVFLAMTVGISSQTNVSVQNTTNT